MRDFSGYELPNLNVLISNYIRAGQVHTEEFAQLIRVREEKWMKKGEPDIYKSLTLLKERAKAHTYASYGDLAAASGLAWSHTMRARMSNSKGHLDRLLDLCRHERLPLLTAICVNKQNLSKGLLEPPALAGFVAGAKRLGYQVDDEAAFLKTCQDDCFRWGREQQSAT